MQQFSLEDLQVNTLQSDISLLRHKVMVLIISQNTIPKEQLILFDSAVVFTFRSSGRYQLHHQ